MAEFRPVNEDHSIQAVTFAVRLDKNPSAKAIELVKANHHLWQTDLPAVEVPQEVGLSSQGVVTRPSNDVMFSFVRPDGTPSWVFKFVDSELSVECSRYTRWDRVWEAAHRYLTAGLGLIAQEDPKLEIRLIALRVIDKYRVSSEVYDLNNLFKASRYISKVVFDAGPLWHNYVGWFRNDGPHQILERLHLEARREEISAPGSKEAAKGIAISATHFQQLRYQPPKLVSEYDGSDLDRATRSMHDANKRMLGELLNSEMAKRIGLLNGADK